MAKGSRASTRKRNGTALREKVFNPVYDARLDRLSAKLQAIADAPKPDSDKPESKPTEDEDEQADVMQWTAVSDTKAKKQKAASKSGRVAKRKAKNQVVFPSEIARKKRQTQKANKAKTTA